MSKLVEINLRPDDRTLRQFGWIALGGFALLALCAANEWLVFRHGLGAARLPVAAALAGLGLLSALFSLAYPRANAPLFVGLSVVAFPIGFVLSYVILATLFYLVIAPVGFALRLFGADPMERALPAERHQLLGRRAPAAAQSRLLQTVLETRENSHGRRPQRPTGRRLRQRGREAASRARRRARGASCATTRSGGSRPS